jgi:hypothetical protein
VRNGEDGPCVRLGSLAPIAHLFREACLERTRHIWNGREAIFGNPKRGSSLEFCGLRYFGADESRTRMSRVDRKRVSEGEAKGHEGCADESFRLHGVAGRGTS